MCDSNLIKNLQMSEQNNLKVHKERSLKKNNNSSNYKFNFKTKIVRAEKKTRAKKKLWK